MMRLCFEFLGSSTTEPRKVALEDFQAILDLCDERRSNSQKGFLVRAENKDEALCRRANAPKIPDEYYIL